MTDPRRAIPSVDRLLSSEAFGPLLEDASRAAVREALEAVLFELRAKLVGGAAHAPVGAAHAPAAEGWYAERVAERLASTHRASLRRVINATGVVLHTNLGRAPLAEAARAAMAVAAAGYVNLEYDLEAGARGSRYDHCVTLLRELTGAEAALIVNNNAAAVALALNTIAREREVVVSRGELVEIGGSFRIPEIVTGSGARLREVGTTNRTHLVDYEAAVGEETAAILKVHRSNFRITGFTAQPELAELAEMARRYGVPLVEDLGSGLFFDLTDLGLPREPTARESLRAGASIVSMSGDKLLGGPQAGILLGAEEWIAPMRRNPLCRALRVDKVTLAALEATLALYRDPDRARREIPTLRMLAAPASELERRAVALRDRLIAAGIQAEVRKGESAVGGGALPGATLPTTLVAVELGRSAHEAERALRLGEPPVVARIVDGSLVLDPRTVFPDEEAALVSALEHAKVPRATPSGGGDAP